MTETNAEIARRGLAAAAGDFEAIADLLDPAVRRHGGESGGLGLDPI